MSIIESKYDATAHYNLGIGPVDEFGDVEESPPTVRNVGWTLGNACPYRCHHCYSSVARREGKDLSAPMIDRIVEQLTLNKVQTVNLGGNEPLFTNGPDPKNTMLPYIIKSLVEAGIEVGLTTSGISLLYLHKHFPWSFDLLNDIDVSLDSPYEEEHNLNRGAALYRRALKALQICQLAEKPHTCIMAGMRWNFTEDRLIALVQLAKMYDANIRINPVKPVEPKHIHIALTSDQYYLGFSLLMQLCDPIDLGEPPIAAVTDHRRAHRCPCGRTSFRIHSITPDGSIYVSPCVYLHDYKAPFDLLQYELSEIIMSHQFRVFRQRNRHPEMVLGCSGCELIETCGGGCIARSYLHHVHKTGIKTLLAKDPYCPKDFKALPTFPQQPKLLTDQDLVHIDYLCTWIGRPK